MCDTCGCGMEAEGPDSEVRISPVHRHGVPADAGHGHPHDHPHSHDVGHPHDHPHPHDRAHGAGHDASPEPGAGPAQRADGPAAAAAMDDPAARSVQVLSNVMAKNDRLAEQNRGWFEGRGVLALNLVSSPGAGKTALLERTLRDLEDAWPWAVIEGDQQTDNDARRIAACGAPVVQINTGAACHLDAQMVQSASRALDPPAGAVLMIENVGNLVCPALFDLGESAKVVVASVTEGEDKPAKYPYMFQAAELVILNKIDLLPYVQFDTGRFEQLVRQVNARAQVLAVSATRGDNLSAWYEWMRAWRSAAPDPAARLPGQQAQPSSTALRVRRSSGGSSAG